MPAFANPSSRASVAKGIPALVARQLSDNKPATVTLLSSGNPWYLSEKFWIPAGIVLAILIIGGVGACAAGGNDISQKIEDAEADGSLAAWRKMDRDAERAEAQRIWEEERPLREARENAQKLEDEEDDKVFKKKVLEKEFREDRAKAIRKARVKKMMDNRLNNRFSE